MFAQIGFNKKGVVNEVNNHFSDIFTKTLNKEFVHDFLLNFDEQVLQEFIDAVDVLRDITESASFPSGKLLNNKDVTDRVVLSLKRVADIVNDKSLYGAQVSKETEELINEFFEYKYPRLSHRIFEKMGFPFLVFYQDGLMFQISFQRQLGSLKDYCSIVFNNSENGAVCQIPFHVSRCNEA